MRAYKEALQQLLKNKLLNFRADHEYSQEHIAELLHISPRALFDLESGKYGFSALTLMFFLSVMKESEVETLLTGFPQSRGCGKRKDRKLTLEAVHRAAPAAAGGEGGICAFAQRAKNDPALSRTAGPYDEAGTMQSRTVPCFCLPAPALPPARFAFAASGYGAEACPRESALRAAPLRNKPVINRE